MASKPVCWPVAGRELSLFEEKEIAFEDWGLVWPEYRAGDDAFCDGVFQTVCDEEPVGSSFDLSETYRKLLEKLKVKHKPKVIACDCYQ